MIMSKFQYENVILPDEPVLLVNRDWQVPGRKPRGSKKGQELHSGGKVHSFRIKGPAEGSNKIQLESSSSKRKAAASTKTTAPRKGCFPVERKRTRDLDERGEQTQPMEQSSSEALSYEGEAFEARLLDGKNYSVVPNSRTSPINRSMPGLDTRLVTLVTYDLPSFIPKGLYFGHYLENIANVMYPLRGLYKFNPLRSVFLPIILVDELWFYCILYIVARHMTVLSNERSLERECTFLADKLYQTLRRRLEMSFNGDGLTDIDCAAVSCLLFVENICGTEEALIQHAKGLGSFVQKRGGVDRISGVLRTKICRADIEAAIDHNREPAINYPHDAETLAVKLRLPGPSCHFTAHPAYESVLSHLSAHLAAIAVDFFSFVRYLDDTTQSQKLLDPFVVDESVLSIEHRLVRYTDSSIPSLDLAFRCACLIFVKCIIRPLDKIPSCSNSLVFPLHQHIKRIRNPPRPLLIWLLFMGHVAGGKICPKRIAISSMLVDELKAENGGALPPWSVVREQLKQVAWVDAIFDEVGEKLWVELDAMALV